VYQATYAVSRLTCTLCTIETGFTVISRTIGWKKMSEMSKILSVP
jgi:hypothetical protein